ncbi:1-acyl-sn-glycerol-3-phosphate acyltransferase [Shewanella yunxiaonensis]|uniref:1-acyl-sn-glycerol-3-phosphate acyltransferase n=1 Tax=Shewanella yunxiaonensis TaxID=2829809 RepID=A0ABX7YPF0_9GAMM|nr:1-acyl-sn-glycerol-3-phosphate acyltransferase [Shewanella yunxiaonensis]QUN04620.1 1-acyl-sn-glycerol-3-phosphate acyltransferase [Shewanella yunxiaonensis]
MTDNGSFDDIRPYHDDEVSAVLARILQSHELRRTLARWRFPRLSRLAPWATDWLVSRHLQRQLSGLKTVAEVQQVVAAYMQRMMATTVTALTVSGLEQLAADKSYLFISNHRDIALDPAFVNIALYAHGQQTVRIAIGDNLLTKDYVTDLMRVNKSFIVKRSASSPREKLKASKQLSAFIQHSLQQEHSHVWLAQREGRAKDGNDCTNAAIISMLSLNRPKTQNFADYIRELNIVPVAISYEWDPCDVAKTRELYSLQQTGEYRKQVHEDIASIASGIAGFKGRVHLAFGAPLAADYANAEAVAAEIDRQIWQNYHLFPSNVLAYRQYTGNADESVANVTVTDIAAQSEKFTQRLQSIAEEQRAIFLAMYANPVLNKVGKTPCG